MKILIVGDVVGQPGRRILKKVVERMRNDGAVNAVIVNAENAAGGNGISEAVGDEIFSYGVDAITLGDHTWDQKESFTYIARERRVVRPANMPAEVPGRGYATFQTDLGPITVVSLMGRVFMNPIDCPFHKIDSLLASTLPKDVPVIVDFHAEATSEKVCMGWHLNGRVCAVVGTHTHVQTSDCRILPDGGTAYITDLGMTGPRNSCLGRDIAAVTRRFITGMPMRFDVAKPPMVLEGVMLDVERATGKAKSITAIREVDDGASS